MAVACCMVSAERLGPITPSSKTLDYTTRGDSIVSSTYHEGRGKSGINFESQGSPNKAVSRYHTVLRPTIVQLNSGELASQPEKKNVYYGVVVKSPYKFLEFP